MGGRACPPLCSAGLAAAVNLALLVAVAQPPHNGWVMSVFAVALAASLTLLLFHSNPRVTWWAGWALIVTATVKLTGAVVFSVAAAVLSPSEGLFAALGVIIFTILAIAAGLSAALDGFAGYTHVRTKGERVSNDEI
jgi:hypothetical protein